MLLNKRVIEEMLLYNRAEEFYQEMFRIRDECEKEGRSFMFTVCRLRDYVESFVREIPNMETGARKPAEQEEREEGIKIKTRLATWRVEEGKLTLLSHIDYRKAYFLPFDVSEIISPQAKLNDKTQTVHVSSEDNIVVPFLCKEIANLFSIAKEAGIDLKFLLRERYY